MILGWHNVDSTWFFPGPPGIGQRRLEQQLNVLSRIFAIGRLSDTLERLYAGKALPPRAAALTFDDGYRDNLEVAMPILERRRLPATFFLAPSLLDGTDAWWERVGWACARARARRLDWEGSSFPLDSAASRRRAAEWVCERLKTLPHEGRQAAIDDLVERLGPGPPSRDRLFLDWEGASRLARRPGAEIGSHSRRHDILSRQSAAEQVVDLTAARHALRSRLDVPVDALAYPNGTVADYDERTIAAAREAGHAWAVTTRVGVNRSSTPPFELRRAIVDVNAGVMALVRPWPIRRWRQHDS